MKTFFIADTHFGDERIMKYENRPFLNAEEMNSTIICNWNSTVGENDTVFVLGDFGADDNEKEIIERLNGKIFLVKGNHDVKSNSYYRSCGMCEVYDCPIIIEGFWILSHEPVYVNTNMPYANLFGHVHANPIYADFSEQHFCVSAERIEYTPIEFEKIKQAIKSRK